MSRVSSQMLVEAVRPFVPEAAVDHVARTVAEFPLEVCIVRPRRTKLGDHRPPAAEGRPHRITININLNPYAFLTTLLHEVAHAATWERHGRRRRRLKPHGAEWKGEFSAVLAPLVSDGVLPDDITAALARSLANPAAATCSDRQLVLALARYDVPPVGRVRVEDLPHGAWFRVDGRHTFQAGRLVRTRRQCFDHRTGREYRVHGLLFVEPLADVPPRAGSAPARDGVGARIARRWRRTSTQLRFAD